MIKAGLGANPIEKRAIDAYLERLQVEIDPATREIRSAGKVMGGMEALSKLASATGKLTLKELAQVEQSRGGYDAVRNHIARMQKRDNETIAHATLKNAQANLQTADDAL